MRVRSSTRRSTKQNLFFQVFFAGHGERRRKEGRRKERKRKGRREREVSLRFFDKLRERDQKKEYIYSVNGNSARGTRLCLAAHLGPLCSGGGGDCGFGGLRGADGLCKCRPEWRGQNCTQLSLLPAANPFAFSSPAANVSSWGGSVQPLPASGAGGYAMAVAVMAGHCGLNTWESNSQIVLAYAATPEGPFLPSAATATAAGSVLLPPFAHNPTLHVLSNGSLLVAHIGQGVPERPLWTNCSQGFTPRGATAAAAAAAVLPPAPPLQLGVAGTPLPAPNFLYLPSGDPRDGSPWRVLNSSGGSWAANNPSLWVDPSDGSALLVYKVHCSCSPPCTFCAQFGVATAPSWGGPYTDRGLIDVYGEDAYVWRDPRGVDNGGWHMLFQGGSYAPNYPQYSGHWHTAYSGDGLQWVVEAASMVFGPNITLRGGGEVLLSRRERHQVLLNAQGAPIYLYNGAMSYSPTSDHTFTVGQPIADV